eukprot:g1476.t1
MDVCKIRLQNQAQLGSAEEKLYSGFTDAVSKIIRQEGVFSFRNSGLWLPGMTPSMFREFGYSSFRFGLYPTIKSFYSPRDGEEGADIGLVRKMAAGLTTGGLGSALANPFDLIKIRMQREAGRIGSDGTYQTGLRKGYPPTYTGMFDAFRKISKTEGVRGLYVGVSATMGRAALLAAGQLASYDHTKSTLGPRGIYILNDDWKLHIIASLVAGLAATTLSQPVDTIKSRLMADSIGKQLYKGPIDCFIKTLRHDGLRRGLFCGWLPSYCRLGPHFILAMPLWEQVRRILGLGYLR